MASAKPRIIERGGKPVIGAGLEVDDVDVCEVTATGSRPTATFRFSIIDVGAIVSDPY